MSTKIIFRSGLDTIGGTIVEVIKDDNRLIFDFGTSFEPESKEEKIPDVKGIYDNTSPYNDCVLISHLHLDHTKAINLINKEIPIYMSSLSHSFLNDLYNGGFDDIAGEVRKYETVEFNKKNKINGFNITFFPVDHDVIGASAILIENDDLTILYTGDYRFRGRNNHYMEELLTKVPKCDLVITEGVTISFVEDNQKIKPEKIIDELEIEFSNKFKLNELEKYHNILFNTYIMGLERLESICELATKMNKNIYLFEEKYQIAMKYLSDYSHLFKLITNQETIENSIVEFKFDCRDKYLKFYKDSYLIQSGGEPLGDYDPRYQILLDYNKKNNITFNPTGLGGHATPNNLLWFLTKIDHNYLVPLHSFKRHLVKVSNSKQLLVNIDDELEFDNHSLK